MNSGSKHSPTHSLTQKIKENPTSILGFCSSVAESPALLLRHILEQRRIKSSWAF